MKPLQAVKNYFREQVRKAFNPMENIDLNKVVGWQSIGGSSSYGYYKDNQYENGYSSISKLGNGFAQIEPYTMDKDGKSVASNVLDRLYTPNTDMSAFDFREALAVTFLVHDKVKLKVHHKTTRVTAESITGFTFLEDYTESIVDGKRLYRLPNGDTLDDTEVITLKSINPNAVTEGFSASRAARRWTRLDDYIADYQKGFFENGAVPAGEMIITAQTVTEFNDIVDTLQAKHRGAGKNNNISYVHRPTDSTGKPMNAQIEWVPFSVANKDMALKDLFANVNQKIDSAFGVPASIRGVNDQNTYASVRIDELIFVKYALNPMTLKIWSKFNHELNRITAGMGLAISYELDMPHIADEEKIKAEAKQVEANTVGTLVTQGFTLESAVAYVESGDLSALIVGEPPKKDEPEVVDANEIKDTPEQPIDIYSKSLQADLAEIKKLLTIKKKELKPQARRNYEKELADVVRNRMTVQVENVIKNYDGITKAISVDSPVEAIEDMLLTTEMLSVLLTEMLEQGALEHAINTRIVLEAGISDDGIEPFRLTAAQRAEYQAYVNKVATGYNAETAEKIRQIIEQGRLNDLSAADIKRDLRKVLDEEYRIRRIAVTEVNNAGTKSSLYSMQEIAAQTGADVDKVWTHGGGDAPCQFCESLIGTTVGLSQDFVELNQQVLGIDGSVYINDFEPRNSGGLHPNCHCGPTYRVRR